jgi:hypothetical protein
MLTWAPPHLTDPQVIVLARGQTVTRMDPDKDYVIRLPREGKGDTFLVGGRNVVIVGGHVSSGGEPTLWDVPEHRGIYIAGATGVVHIEGVLIDDVDVGKADGIDVAAPEAIVQIQNVRIVGLTGSQEENHADVVQVWGGVKELRIDRLTGATDYQGLHVQPELAPNGPEIIKNTNVSSTSTTAGNWLAWLTTDSNTCETPARVELSEVYVTPRDGRSLGNSVWPPDRNANAAELRSSRGVRTCASELSADGTQLAFPQLPQVSGVIKKGPPPGGDFVPDGVAGPDYVSPGYLG